MKNRNSSRFLIGLLFGVLVGAIIWYWQKSTSAENGALALLDRLAAAESRLRELRIELGRSTQGVDLHGSPTAVEKEQAKQAVTTSDDLTTVRGVGPVFEQRLRAAGITSIRQLAGSDATTVAEALEVNLGRAKAIVSEARKLAG